MRNVLFALLAISILLYVFLYAPIAAVIAQSFNVARHGAEWRGFTFGWYRALAHNDAALHATMRLPHRHGIEADLLGQRERSILTVEAQRRLYPTSLRRDVRPSGPRLAVGGRWDRLAVVGEALRRPSADEA